METDAAKTSSQTEVIPGSNVLLHVYPLELCFLFESNKLTTCSLDLTNNTDENVAFVLMEKSNDMLCFLCLPMCGIVPPRSTYTLGVTANDLETLSEERNVYLILQNIIVDPLFSFSSGIQNFQTAKDFGNTVYTVTLRAICAPHGETTFEQANPPLIKIIWVEKNLFSFRFFHSVDASQTEPLGITGDSYGFVQIQHYDTQKSMGLSKVSEGQVWSTKFIERKRWFVAGSAEGFVHVYKYEKRIRKITSFKAHDIDCAVHSLAVHPTQSYVLSGYGTEIKLWDWDQDWKCIQTFEENSSTVCQVAFNPEDTDSFASALADSTIKVWSLQCPNSKYALSGHSACVKSLNFFTHDGQQYLVTGSWDKTAKIWDMHKKTCICTLTHSSEVSHVISHPILPVLVTGTLDGHVYLWSSTNFRLKGILNICNHSSVSGLACLMGSGRVVVVHREGLSVIEIRDEKQGGSKDNNEHSITVRG